ncbi:MAG: hypothetical protein R2729_00825 [Bryobacteraceae bacterium]
MRHSFRLFAAAVLAVMLWIAAIPAEASILGTYSDRATWEGLTSGRTDINFDALGLTPGGYTQYNNSAGLTVGDVNFVGYEAGSYDLTALNPLAGWDEDYNTGTLLRGPFYYADSYLLVTFNTNITSFALDLMTMATSGQDFEIIVDGVSLGTISTAAQPATTFWGVRTDTPITSIRFQLASGSLTVTKGLFDNIALGLATAGGGGSPPPPGETPEAGTLLLTGVGLALVARARRRHPRHRPTPMLAARALA